MALAAVDEGVCVLKIPSLPTPEMIAAGAKTLADSMSSDRMYASDAQCAEDIFHDMMAAAPVMGASGNEISRFFDRLANPELPENRRWLAEQGPPILTALCGEIIRRAEAKRADDRKLTEHEIFAADLAEEDGWIGEEARRLSAGSLIHSDVGRIMKEAVDD